MEIKHMKEIIMNTIQRAIDIVDWTKTCHSNGKPTIIYVKRHISKEFSNEENDGYSICISAGMNGRGIWSNYLEALAKFMFQLELFYPNAYLIKIDNDAVDDVFYFYVGITK